MGWRQARARWALALLLLLASGRAWGVQAVLVADAHVNAARPVANSGTLSNLNIGGGYSSLVQFSLATLPAETTAAQVSRATLTLYCNRVNTPGTITLQPVGSAWGEYSVTFATLPASIGVASPLAVGAADSFVAVDVTALVQGWVAAPATNFGMVLTASAADVQFDSKENDQTGHAPVLEVTLVNSGPAGPSGSVGPQGPVGVQGPVGLPGPQGAKGDAGVAGAMGPAGLSGVPGVPGPTGPAGATGPVGPVGLQFQGAYSASASYRVGDGVLYGGAGYVSLGGGNQGNAPDRSPGAWSVFASGGAGPAGPQGPVGSTGANGAPGPQGVQGVAGLNGAVGPAGRAGADGPPGAAGSAGPIGLTGSQGLPGPIGPTGARGLQGVAGPAGANGLPGAVGATGAPGPAGPTGQAGATGPVGPAGAPGAAGAAGPRGLTGATGPAGPSGTNGATGATGPSGSAGPAGPGGPTGPGATVTVGSVTTGAPGSAASVTNIGTPTAAVFNFAIPQGSAGAGGINSGASISSASTYHSVSNQFLYYSVANSNMSGATDGPAVLTWIPNGCTATTLMVYSEQGNQVTLRLRNGPSPSTLADTAFACTVIAGQPCTSRGSVAIGAGTFIDFSVLGADGTPSPVWTALTCN